jgi:hypothetical protein
MPRIDLIYYVFAVIVIYVPFHLFEEAAGDFPRWMYTHKWIPERITYGHWMANNIFFYFSLLQLGFIVFALNPGLVFLGIGIVIWGFLNTLDHLAYTILDRKRSPGLYTGILYAIAAAAALETARKDGLLSPRVLLLSIAAGVAYAFLPVLLSMAFHKAFKRLFA